MRPERPLSPERDARSGAGGEQRGPGRSVARLLLRSAGRGGARRTLRAVPPSPPVKRGSATERSLFLIKTGALGSGAGGAEEGRAHAGGQRAAAPQSRRWQRAYGRRSPSAAAQAPRFLRGDGSSSQVIPRRVRGHPPAKPALPSLPAGLLRPNTLRWRTRLRGKPPAATQTCAGAVATAGARPLPAKPRSPQTSGGFGGFSGFSGNFSRKTGGSKSCGEGGGRGGLCPGPALRYRGMRRRIRRPAPANAGWASAPCPCGERSRPHLWLIKAELQAVVSLRFLIERRGGMSWGKKKRKS